MKEYKEFDKVQLGDSDKATITMIGLDYDKMSKKCELLHFNADGSYKAYLCDGKVIIGDNYKKVATFYKWVEFYDDYGYTYTAKADIINIYRRGDFGCIIELINEV